MRTRAYFVNQCFCCSHPTQHPKNIQNIPMHHLKLTYLSFALLRIHSFTFHSCMHDPAKLKCQFHVAYNYCILFFNTEFDIYPNSQSPGFKPGTDAIHLPYFFKHKLSKNKKIIKTINNLIIKELRNPDSLSLIEICRSEVKSLSGPF